MIWARSIILCTSISFKIVLSAQCPDKDSLWKRLIFLRDSYKIPPSEKLKELLPYEKVMKNCSYEDDSTSALLKQRLGMAYFGLSEYLKAIQYLNQSIQISNKIENRKFNIWNYFYLSATYDSLNNARERMKAIDSCVSIAMKFESGSDIACLYSLLAKFKYYYNSGDYYNCIEYAKICEKFAWQYAKQDSVRGRSFASSSLGWQIMALQTLQDFDAAEKLLANKIKEYKEIGLQNYLGSIYGQMAQVQIHKGDYNKAILYLDLELKYEYEAGYYFYYAQTLNTIGYEIYYKHFNDDDRALTFYRNALQYVYKRTSPDKTNSMECLNILTNIANVYVRKGWYDSAFRNFQLAFDQIEPGLNEGNLLSSVKLMQLKNIHYVADLLISKGDAFRKKYMLSKQKDALTNAARTYKAADLFLEKIKTDISDLESKLFWRKNVRQLYENAIQTSYLQNNLTDGFYFFEKSRAVLLQDQLDEQRWSDGNNIQRKTQLEKRILQLERELNSTVKSSTPKSELENELFNNKRELEQSQNLIRTTNPLYYQNFVERNFIQMKDVHDKILKDHQALVELFSGDSAVYILVITQQKESLQKIDKADFDRLSDAYRNFISNPELLNRNFETFKDISLQLYQLLFQNIELPAGRIIISPDGKNFPFEALITNAKPLTYFLDDHAVSYTYSARYLLNQFTTNTVSGSAEFMGIAPVHYTNGFPALSGSDRSLRRVQRSFSSPVSFIGSDASKNNFLKQYFNYKIIQLYTHATDSGYSGEPTIYFSDSAMLLSDLFYESKPITNLIVLSACETAGGKLYNGEGVFSFNRQFAALGIPSSVSNLWEADDQSTYEITELFYKYLSKGMALDEALQKAKKEFRKTSTGEKELPYYWAAAILVGQTNSISLQGTFPWMWMIAIIIILLVFLAGLKISGRYQPKSVSTRPSR